LPLLADRYGRVLERGELQLRFENGTLLLRYFDRDLPINPRGQRRESSCRMRTRPRVITIF
jgi:(1->4)-alpha-D-glucan 1-alpha-D-glucosylmutase